MDSKDNRCRTCAIKLCRLYSYNKRNTMVTYKDIHPKDKVLIESFSNISRKIEEVKLVAENYIVTTEGNKYSHNVIKKIIKDGNN